VVGRDQLLVLAHDERFALGPAMTRSIDSSSSRIPICCRLCRAVRRAASLMEVGQVSAGEAGVRLASVSRLTAGPAACRGHARPGSPAAVQIRAVHHNLSVEAPGPAGGRVKDVRTVGGGNQDDPTLHVETIHLDSS